MCFREHGIQTWRGVGHYVPVSLSEKVIKTHHILELIDRKLDLKQSCYRMYESGHKTFTWVIVTSLSKKVQTSDKLKLVLSTTCIAEC